MNGRPTQGRLTIHISELLRDVWLVAEHHPAVSPLCAAVAMVVNKVDARRLVACWNAFEGVPTEEIDGVISELRSQIIGERVTHAEELAKTDARYDAKHDAMADLLTERDQLRAELDAANTERKRLAHELATALAAVPSSEQGTGDYPEIVRGLAEDVVHVAGILGQVLTITQRPRLPYAMGNYDTVVEVRPARGEA